MKDKVIFLVDMQSFYASVEKADHPEYKDRPLVVAGDPARLSGIVLAACPIAKKNGVVAGLRLGEVLRLCPEVVVKRPRMQQYITVSLQITEILERYTDLVEPYSIDEQFLDVTGSRGLFGNPWSMALAIQADIGRETGVYARVGIGPNKALAKIACDNFGKKRPEGIFELNESNMKDSMWPLPVNSMFGVGSRINLPRNYATLEDIRVVLLELCEEVCRRARRKKVKGETVSAGCRDDAARAQGAACGPP